MTVYYIHEFDALLTENVAKGILNKREFGKVSRYRSAEVVLQDLPKEGKNKLKSSAVPLVSITRCS